ncbi:hypothetical protein L211DRAFT_195442 [Terfezia boudieri ATCC MYA-4762]|uniref:Uncharacterized protein n=1 Tax=Terfezia boudieri ATCC MYA-4762 TaxID=1051890 RepID=A0A3N4M247_9PEZI|nr:hypothetical protein L211DRAFT_195442 [Terfezia boudieri ATCC MYA-4762]
MSSHDPMKPIKKEWKFCEHNSMYEPPPTRGITSKQQIQIRPEFLVNTTKQAETITSIDSTAGTFMLEQPSTSANQLVSTVDTPPPEALLNIVSKKSSHKVKPNGG